MWPLPGGRRRLVSLDHDLDTNSLSIGVDGTPLSAARQPGNEPVVGTYLFQVAGEPSCIVVSRERLRRYLLWGGRHYVYDLIHAGRRIAYGGAVRQARRALLFDGALATFGALVVDDVWGDRLPRFVAFIALLVLGLLLAGPIVRRWPPKATSGGHPAHAWSLLALWLLPFVALLLLLGS